MLCVVWGSTWLVIKEGYGGLGAFNVASLRFLIAGLVMTPIAFALRVPWPKTRPEWSVVAVVGTLLFATHYGLIYWAELTLDSGLTAVLFAVMPLITAALAHAYLPKERLTPRKLVGALIAFGGIAALFGDSLRFDASLALPMAAVLVGASLAAAASVVTKKHGAELHPAAINAPAMLLGGVLLAGASFVAGDGYSLPSAGTTWSAVLYLAVIGSVLTFLVYFHLLRTWEATTMSYIAIFTPVVALALGFWVRQERLTAWAGVGAALVLVGVLIALTRGPAERVRGAAAEPEELES